MVWGREISRRKESRLKKAEPRAQPRARAYTFDLLAPALLLGLGAVFFADVLFSSKNFYYRDILNFHYPLRRVLIDSYARGELPLWNPFVYLGQPMLANPNYMAFYPTNLLHLLAPFNYAFKLHFVLHPILGGLGAYFLLRRLALGPLPSLAGALAYEFSGTVLSFLNLYNLVPAVALIPWIGWAFQGALHGRRVRRTLLLGFLLALQAIAFEPLLFQCCALLLLALTALYITEQDNRKRALRTAIGVLLPAGLSAAGLAAAQIVPALELLPLSARGAGIDYSVASGWSMHPMDLLSIFIPNFYGTLFTIGSVSAWGEMYHEFKDAYLVSFFLGSSTLLLAALALFSQRTKLRNVLLAFCALTLVLALGKFAPLYPFLYRHVPLFDLGRYPSKYFLLATLLISMLAALGLEAALEPRNARAPERTMRPVLAAGLIAGGAALCLGLFWGWKTEALASLMREATPPAIATTKDFQAVAAGLARSLLATGAFFGLTALILSARHRLRNKAGWTLAAVVALELMPPNLGLFPLISDADMDYVPELARTMKENGPAEPFRAVTPNYMNPVPTSMVLKAPNRSAAWFVLYNRRSGQSLDGIRQGLQYALDRSVDYLNSRESDTLMQRSLELTPERKLTLLANLNCAMVPAIGELQDPRLSLIGPIETHSNLDYRLYRLEGALPRAYFASSVIPAASPDEALARLLEANSALAGRVILESPGAVAASGGGAAAGRAEITRYGNNRVACRVSADAPGFLVLLDSWYPGWKAYVDGRETEVLRANYAFRAVALSAGRHDVEFVFEPMSFRIGAAVSVLTLLTGLAAAVLAAKR